MPPRICKGLHKIRAQIDSAKSGFLNLIMGGVLKKLIASLLSVITFGRNSYVTPTSYYLLILKRFSL